MDITQFFTTHDEPAAYDPTESVCDVVDDDAPLAPEEEWEDDAADDAESVDVDYDDDKVACTDTDIDIVTHAIEFKRRRIALRREYVGSPLGSECSTFSAR